MALPNVRYQENGDNRLLRHVLRLVWDQQCYWCRNFKGYVDLEIDHILARTSGETARLSLKRMLNLVEDFDVHALYNLAPICQACNSVKGSDDFTKTGLVLSVLKKARRLAPVVARQVAAFGKPSKLAGALLEATEVDLSDLDLREIFEQGAPAIVQRLAELGKDKADHLVFRTVDVEAGGELYRVDLKLNERGRAAQTVLETVAGGRLDHALRVPLIDLFSQVAFAATRTFEAHGEGWGAADVEPVTIDRPQITIDRVRLESTPPAQLEFAFAGEFDTMVTTVIARGRQLDGDLEYVQGDATVSGRFTFDLSWEPGDPVGHFLFDQVWLEDPQADVWVDGGAFPQWDDIVSAHQTDND